MNRCRTYASSLLPGGLVLMMHCLLVFSVHAQGRVLVPLPAGSRAPIAPFVLRDADNVPLGHHVAVDQIREKYQLEVKVGELELRTMTGDTLGIAWDHPLNRSMVTPVLPVYEYNSVNFRNPVYSQPFTIMSGDTLWYHAIHGVDFPVLDTALQFHAVPDTAGIVVEDTLTVRMELVDDADGSLRALLEEWCFTPASGLSELLLQQARRMSERGGSRDGIGRWVPAASDVGRRFRVHIVPVHHPQRDGRFERRALYCRFRWEERASLADRELGTWMPALLDRLLDSLDALRKATALQTAEPLAITVTPTTMRRGVEQLVITLPEGASAAGTVEILTVDGRMIERRELRSPSSGGRVTMKWNTTGLAAGSYLAIIRMGGRVGTAVVQLLP